MNKQKFGAIPIGVIFFLMVFSISCSNQNEKKEMTKEDLVALGRYIVTTGGCDDCHTPKIYTPNGPVPDTTKRFAGFLSETKLPVLDTKFVMPGNWVATESNFSGWVGPWGISFASNLTPDNETGIGTLSEEMFIKTLREGKLMGVGRPLLPPMPWQVLSGKTDQDLKAMYAYLKTVKPIHNQVPQPVPPDKMKEFLTGK
jgi:hypothetical protein